MSGVPDLAPEDRPIRRVIFALLERDPGGSWTQPGERRYYRCPAHADRSPSLSVAEGQDGRALVHCFAGCTVEEVCRALGLTIRDLFVPRGPEQPEGPRFESARGVLSVFVVKYPEIAWLIEQVREDRLFYLDDGDREKMLRKQFPSIPNEVWAVLKR